jgi:prepilin-type N-terminal cleavage/methylation domain-containing protein
MRRGCPTSPCQDVQGFSLLELLLAISLLGVLAGITSLQLAPLLNRTSLNNGVRQIVSDLQRVPM